MKKIYIIFAVLVLLTLIGQFCISNSNKLSAKEIDFHNFPAAQDNYSETYTKKSTTSNSASYHKTSGSNSSTLNSGAKASLDTLAMKALKAAENHDNATMNQYLQQMVQKGVDSMYQPHIVAKATPTCPPIKMPLNGKTLSGSLCAKIGYVYKGKTYWVGYCKP